MNWQLRMAFGIAALLSTALLNSSVATAQQSAPIFTNQPGFSIPYRFDQTEMRRLRAKEIRLFLSRNGGADWQHVQTVAPDAGRFKFKAPNDGEYWFAVRTLDGTNQLHPDGNVSEPELIVIVDRSAPEFKLALQPAEAGKVQLSWNASDTNLDPSKLSLEFSQAGGQWQPVSVRSQPSGQTSWSVPTGGQVSVRGSIADRAGNEVTDQTSVAIQASGVANGRPAASEYTQPVAGTSNSLADTNSFPFGPSIGVPMPPSPAPANESFSAPGASRGTASAPTYPTPFPSEAKVANSFQQATISSSGGQGKINNADWGLNRNRVGSSGRFKAVKSHRFEINYRIDDVGPSGVSSVELFITQNNGQKWFKYGDDADKQSPFVVEVPEDGIYGFAIRVRSGAGLADEPPQSNEEPSIVLVVDRTPPVVQLAPVQQGAGGQLNRINISWRVTDDNPSDKPISLSYSANPNGPWEPICSWQQDTGSYAWSVNQGVPSRLYIRVVARDAAGNHSYVDTPQPILVDLSKPTGRIVDVESNGPQ